MSTAQNPRLRAQGLVKAFAGARVLDEVSFDARRGRVLGMVGENGSGKSTAMNLLTGILQPDAGRLWLDGEPFAPRSRRESDAAGIAFIQQELNIFPNLTVAENLFLARPPRRMAALPLLAHRQIHERAMRLLDLVNLQVLPGTSAGALSMGERQLLEIARGLLQDARVLILDEPTSSLNVGEAARLFEIIRRLKERGVAIVLVSHDLDQVLTVCEDIVVLRDGRVALSGAAASLTASDLVLAMVGRPIEAQFPRRVRLLEASQPILEIKGLGEPGVLDNIHFCVAPGEIVGIAGLMGSGRSELARAIFGLDPFAQGAVRDDGQLMPSDDVASRIRAGVAFLTEDRRHEGLLLDASVSDNVALACLRQFASARGGLNRPALEAAVRAIVERLKVKCGNIVSTRVRTLSGGNQQKVVLARWLLGKPKVFILDEPTRGVDVGAKQEIYRLLVEMAESGMAILIISSDLTELIGLCDRIMVMRGGELNASFERETFDREAVLRAAFGQGEAA